MVKSNVLFSKLVIALHPIFGSDSEGWEMSIIPKDSMKTYAKFDVSIIGIMQNSFASPVKYLCQQPSDTEKNILIEPIFEDTLGQRSRTLVKELTDDFVAQRGKVVDARKGKISSQLPTRMMFLQDLNTKRSRIFFQQSTKPTTTDLWVDRTKPKKRWCKWHCSLKCPMFSVRQ